MNSGLGRHSTCIIAGLTSRQAKCRLLGHGKICSIHQDPEHPNTLSVTVWQMDQSQWTMDVDIRWILDPRAGPVQGHLSHYEMTPLKAY